MPGEEVQPFWSETQATPVPEQGGGRLRWKWLVVFLFVVGVLIGIAIALSPDRSVRTVVIYWALLPLGCILSLVWWTFLSGLEWVSRRLGLITVFALLAFAIGLVRVDGFNGDMFPIFAWRWSPTPEERAADFRQQALSGTPEKQATEVRENVAAEATDWPTYRGPQRDGVVRDVKLNRDFTANPPREIWRHPVGLGWGSFTVVGEFCWTMEQLEDEEATVCYKVADGTLVWIHADKARFSEALGGDGPRSTPTYHEGKLYSQGATGILNCLDAFTGRKLWSTNVLEDAGESNLTWAMSAAPLIVDDTVVVNAGGAKGSGEKAVIAYDIADGTIRWSAGKHPGSYAGLRIETIHGERQLILYDGHGVAGLKPETGRQLWRFEWNNSQHVNAAQPIVRDEHLVFVSASYSSGSALVDVQRDGKKWTATPVWAKRNFFKLKFNDGVYRDGFVYGLDESYLSCIEFETGNRKWKARSNTGYGQLLLIDDVLVVQCENGELAFVEATPEEYRELYRQPALTGKTWNVPAYHEGKLLLRNSQEAVCYELKLTASP